MTGAAIIRAYRRALDHLFQLLALHLSVRLAVSVLLLPLAGVFLGLVLRWSGDPALTDQEIAGLLFSPMGVLGALAVIAVLIVAAILDLALMTALWRRPVSGIGAALVNAWNMVLPGLGGVFRLALRLLLRILAICLPFLALAGLVALLGLTAHDINYYLTWWPPSFLLAAGTIAVLALLMAGLLIWRLAGWALALHLRLIDGVASRDCLAQSEAYLLVRRRAVIRGILIWLALRLALGVGIAAAMGALGAGAQALALPDLGRVVVVTALTLALWSLVNAGLAAVSNGALAALLDDLHRSAAPRVLAPRPEVAPRGGGLVLGGLAVAAGLAVLGAVTVMADVRTRLAAPQ